MLRPWQVRRGNEKGRVERAIQYVRAAKNEPRTYWMARSTRPFSLPRGTCHSVRPRFVFRCPALHHTRGRQPSGFALARRSRSSSPLARGRFQNRRAGFRRGKALSSSPVGIVTITLGPGQQIARYLHEDLARLKCGGSRVLRGQAGRTFVAVALVQNQRRFTVIPVIPEKAATIPD